MQSHPYRIVYWFKHLGAIYYAGHLADTPMGRKKYVQYLAWLSSSDETKRELSFSRMCRGWALGTREFKKKLATEDRVVGAERLGHDSQEARELYWEGLLDQMMAFLGKSHHDIKRIANQQSGK